MKNQKDVFEILKNIKIFDFLNDQQVRRISRYFKNEDISMGEPIIFGDSIPEYIYILIDGQVRQLVEHPSTKELISLNVENPHYFVGWLSNQNEKPEEFVTAATECNFLKIKSSSWIKIIKDFPKLIELLNQDVLARDIWPLIKERGIEFPQKTKDFRKFIKNIAYNSKSITILPTDEPPVKLDASLEWMVASKFESYSFGEKFSLKKFVKNDSPLRIIGIPKVLTPTANKNTLEKNLLVTKVETVVKDKSENKVHDEVKFKDNYIKNKYKFFDSTDDPILEAVACFRIIAEILDVPVKADFIKRFLEDNLKNNSKILPFNLLAVFSESLGLKTQILDLPAKLINRVNTPSLLQLKNNELAVLIDITKEKLLLARPQSGIKTYSIDDFLKITESDSEIKTLTLVKTSRTLKNDFGLKWFWPAIKKNRKPLIEVLVASLFVQLFQLANPLIIQQIIDKVIGQGGVRTLPVLSILLLSFSFFENILTAVRTNLFIDTTNRIDISLGEQVIDHLLRLPLSFFDKRPVGELSTRLAELEKIRSFLTSVALTVVLDSIFSVIYIAVMIAYSALLTIVALVVAPILALLIFSVTPIVRRQIRTKAELNAHTQNHLIEVITGIQTVKAQNFELKARWKWRERYTKYISESFNNAVTATTYNSLTNFLNQFSSLGILCAGTFLVIRGDLTLGELIAFRIISGRVTTPLLRLSNIYQNFQEVNISIERLSDIMNSPQEVPDNDKLNIPMPKINGKVNFENVSFNFLDRGPLILSKINLNIDKGKFVAIVGESGSGKSTLSKLIARLYEPNEGTISIDNIDISKVELNSLRRQIGIVPQDSILFDGSVQDNICLSDPEASIEDIVSAAKIACANEFIMKLPRGYTSDVGERGSNLSGGQRQRIAIARSVLQNPNLLIMDESTSALDYKTEKNVSLNLMEYFRNRTVLFITHRLTSIVHADLIITMHQGKIEEQGTHSELMALKGRYFALYNQQKHYKE